MTSGAAGLPLAILISLWGLLAIVLSVPLPQIDEQSHTQQALALPAFSPRPPPTQ
jgi:hypothetical protein